MSLKPWLSLAMLCALLGVAQCAPRYITPGPVITQPAALPGAILARDGTELALTSWQAPKAKAILIACHGVNDYGNAFDGPAEILKGQGISTYAFDERGFGDTPVRGRWPGSAAFQNDLSDVVTVIKARNPGVPVYVLGESMGGAVVLSWAAKPDTPGVDGLILVAPAVWGWRALNPLYKATLWIAAHLAPSHKLTGQGLDIWPSDNIPMLRAYSRDPRVIKATRIDVIYGLVSLMDEGYRAGAKVKAPVLVLYGKKDQIVPKAPVLHVVKDLGDHARFIRYPNGYHMLLRDLDGAAVTRDIAAWIADPKATLPSGQEEKTTASAQP
jgi:alpha-beta hydrolase superfamily lysophospholipase